MIIRPDLAKDIVVEKLEAHVTLRGFQRSKDFTATRHPGKIVWSTFNMDCPVPPGDMEVDVMLYGILIAKTSITGIPVFNQAGDMLKITYTLSWSGDGVEPMKYPPHGVELDLVFGLAV